MAFCVWLLSLRFSRCIHVVACVRASFVFTAKGYSIVWTDHILSIRSSVMGIEVAFYFLAINAAVSTGVQVCACACIFISLGCTRRSRMAGSYGSYGEHCEDLPDCLLKQLHHLTFCIGGLQFLHILADTEYLIPFITVLDYYTMLGM